MVHRHYTRRCRARVIYARQETVTGSSIQDCKSGHVIATERLGQSGVTTAVGAGNILVTVRLKYRSITASRPLRRPACNSGIAHDISILPTISGEAAYRLKVDRAEEDQVTGGRGSKPILSVVSSGGLPCRASCWGRFR
jgi:hypothetical protein